MVLVLALQGGEGFPAFAQDVLAPAGELAPEIVALALVHERLVVGRPIVVSDEVRDHAPGLPVPPAPL